MDDLVTMPLPLPRMEMENNAQRFIQLQREMTDYTVRLISECAEVEMQSRIFGDAATLVDAIQQILRFLAKLKLIRLQTREIIHGLEISTNHFLSLFRSLNEFIEHAFVEIKQSLELPVAHADCHSQLEIIRERAYHYSVLTFALAHPSPGEDMHQDPRITQLRDDAKKLNAEQNAWWELYQQSSQGIAILEKTAEAFLAATEAVAKSMGETRHLAAHFTSVRSDLCQHLCAMALCLDSLDTVLSALGIKLTQTTPYNVDPSSHTEMNINPQTNETEPHAGCATSEDNQASQPDDETRFLVELFTRTISTVLDLALRGLINHATCSVANSLALLKLTAAEYALNLNNLNQIINTAASRPIPDLSVMPR